MVWPPVRSILYSRKPGIYLFVHANKPSSISHITVYQCHSVESTLIQGCFNIVCPLGILMCIWRRNQPGRRKHNLTQWSGNEHLSSRVTVLRVGVSPLATKGSKNWCNNVICLCSCRKNSNLCPRLIIKIITIHAISATTSVQSAVCLHHCL